MCYLLKRNELKHIFKVLIIPNKTENSNFVCDGCNTSKFAGHRFRCNECVNFDLCTLCYSNNYGVHKHTFTQY